MINGFAFCVIKGIARKHGLKLNKNTIYRVFEPVSFIRRLSFCNFSAKNGAKIR